MAIAVENALLLDELNQVNRKVTDSGSCERLGKGNIEAKRHSEGNLPAVGGNANWLEQVFMNLIQNAVQARDGAGTQNFNTRHLPKFSSEQAWAEVEVSVCRRIVEEHKGEIEL